VEKELPSGSGIDIELEEYLDTQEEETYKKETLDEKIRRKRNDFLRGVFE
jgi:hypothetical protein